MGSRFRAALVLAVAGALSVSCGGIVDPSQNKVDTFSGTIALQGNGVPHPFSSSKTGEISVKITALSPSSGTLVGLVWAQASGPGACDGQPIQNTLAQLNIPAISNQILKGNYCIQLYDAGYFSTAQTYTVTVSHPPP
jgi:hypothetical protein